MTLFEERKDVFEKAFVKDGVRDFKIESRRAKLFGILAAEKLGLDDDAVQIYADKIIETNLKEPSFEDVYQCVQKDFKEKEIVVSRATMEAVFRKCMRKARKDILS